MGVVQAQFRSDYLRTLQHVLVGIVGDGEQMWGHFNSPLSPIFLDDGVLVDGEATVGVDGDAKESRVCLQ